MLLSLTKVKTTFLAEQQRHDTNNNLNCPVHYRHTEAALSLFWSTPTERISPDFQQVRLRLTTTQPESALLLLLAREYESLNCLFNKAQSPLTLLQRSYSLCVSVLIHTGNTTAFLISLTMAPACLHHVSGAWWCVTSQQMSCT